MVGMCVSVCVLCVCVCGGGFVHVCVVCVCVWGGVCARVCVYLHGMYVCLFVHAFIIINGCHGFVSQSVSNPLRPGAPQLDHTLFAPPPPLPLANPPPARIMEDPLERSLAKLKKKLTQIQELKARRERGETLDVNQVCVFVCVCACVCGHACACVHVCDMSAFVCD